MAPLVLHPFPSSVLENLDRLRDYRAIVIKASRAGCLSPRPLVETGGQRITRRWWYGQQIGPGVVESRSRIYVVAYS